MATIVITTAGQNMLRDSLQGTTNPKITYVSWGTSNTAPTVGDVKLGAEVGRKTITSYTNGGSSGEILITAYIAPNDAAGVVIAEVGFFGGAATAAPNSGTLLAHGLYSHTKLSTESITLTLDLTV